MPLQFNQFVRALMAGGGGAAAPLRFASSLNRFPLAGLTSATTRLWMWLRWPVIIGSSDMSSLKLSFFGKYLGFSGEVNTGQYTIQQMALERVSTPGYTPVTFGGSRSKVINTGDADIQSDAVLPSAFGIAQFSRGETYYLRLQISVAAAGVVIPATTAATGGQPSGSWSMWYDPATFTIANTDGTGMPGFSGTGFNFVNSGQFTVIVLGTPTNTSAKVWAGVGDSIVAGAGDTMSTAGYMGFFQRALVDADLTSNVYAGCGFGYSGGSAPQWNTATSALDFLKYATHVVEEYGTNNGNATAQAASQAIWASVRARSAKVLRTKLLTVTTTTDAWATTVNQTKNANWLAAGERAVFNDTWLPSQSANYDALVDFASVATDGGDRYLWAVNGTANYSTADGTHPTAQLHAQMAGLTRTAMASL